MMFAIGYILGIISCALVMIVVACCVVSGDNFRGGKDVRKDQEEKREEE